MCAQALERCMTAWCGACGFLIWKRGDRIEHVSANDENDVHYGTKVFGNPDDTRRLTIACHSYCVNAYTRPVHLDKLRESYRITVHDYRADVTQELDRIKFLSQKVYPHISKGLSASIYGASIAAQSARIPAEIWVFVSEYLVRTYAATQTLQLLESSKPLEPIMDVMFCRDIWASFVKFENHIYMRSVSNIRQSASDVRIFSPSRTVVDRVLVASNHFGIQHMRFCNSKKIPDIAPKDGTWWHLVIVIPGCCMQVKSDGFKLREVARSDTVYRERVSWTMTKCLNDYDVGLSTMGFHESNRPTRMRPLTLNSPNTSGYSICWNNHNLMEWFPLHLSTPDSAYAAFHPPGSAWLFVQMLTGELITKVWRVYRPRDPDDAPFQYSLLLSTNRNRTLVLGKYPKEQGLGPEYEYELLGIPPAGPNEAYIGADNEGAHISINTPGGEEAIYAEPMPFPPIAATISPYPPTLNEWDQYFYSSAPLEGITSVRVCLRHSDRGWEAIGMVLSYGDSPRKGLLGQIRWDQDILLQDHPIPDCTMLWLRFNTDDAEKPYICHLCFRRPVYDPDMYFPIPMSGVLTWWFTDDTVIVDHYGRRSPVPTRVLSVAQQARRPRMLYSLH